MTTNTNGQLLLSGLDGSNPLAFLAAMGTLRTLSTIYPHASIRIGWNLESGAWRPLLTSSTLELDQDQLCSSMANWLATPPQMPLLESEQLGDNLTISPMTFRQMSREHLERACEEEPQARVGLQFLAAFGTDSASQPHSKGRSLMQDTALRTMSGAGHQHFIKFMRDIIDNTTTAHLHATLFQQWAYQDEGRGMNLRWDPIDDRRYAMRWKNPSSDPATTMRGANRLAIEGLPMFPAAPIGTRLETTGFRSHGGTFFSWPIWEADVELPVVQSMLQFASISGGIRTDALSDLKRRGIATVYTSQRITVGKFRNFTPAKSR